MPKKVAPLPLFPLQEFIKNIPPKTGHLGRASGRKYENPPEKIKELRQKYKNGITSEIWEEFVLSF